MKTPDDKTVTFVYVSHPTKTIGWRWQASLTFPPGADAQTLLPLEIRDGEDNPVDGTFEFAGRFIRIVDGKGELAYSDFIAGKHATAVWLHRTGIAPIPGILTFA